MRIILADDDEELRFILARTLKKEGYNVEELEDTEALRQRMSQNRNATDADINNTILISDVYMPGGNAIEALADLKTQLSLPFIFITSAKDVDVTEQGMRLGARAVLSKPVDFDALKSLLKGISTKM